MGGPDLLECRTVALGLTGWSNYPHPLNLWISADHHATTILLFLQFIAYDPSSLRFLPSPDPILL